MSKDNWLGIIVILIIVAIGIYGGSTQTKGNGIFAPNNTNSTTNDDLVRYDLENKINDAERQVEELRKKVAAEELRKTQSKYVNQVYLSYVLRSDDPKNEYVVITTGNLGTTTINITGWTLKTSLSGQVITIPKSTILFFADSQNTEEDIILGSNETVYLTTGISPNGSSFKVNKCSGYLGQFQNWNPYISTMCPSPKNEDLSSIPRTVNNSACLYYIESMPACRIQTSNLPTNWSYECTNFIYTKINYPSCISTHKSDKDFWQKEWRVYLKRSESVWVNFRESVTLYDREGKPVSTINY